MGILCQASTNKVDNNTTAGKMDSMIPMKMEALPRIEQMTLILSITNGWMLHSQKILVNKKTTATAAHLQRTSSIVPKVPHNLSVQRQNVL